jgi:hypothetical protein
VSLAACFLWHRPDVAGEAMSGPDLFARLTDELPAVEPVVPVAYLDDDLLPRALQLVEPIAFALACARAAWGRQGPRD